MDVPIFTLDELKQLKKEQLLRVAEYLNLSVEKKWDKEKLVVVIWEHIKIPPQPEYYFDGQESGNQEVQKSVRIRRIEWNNRQSGG